LTAIRGHDAVSGAPGLACRLYHLPWDKSLQCKTQAETLCIAI
jgi:hypothetical protein